MKILSKLLFFSVFLLLVRSGNTQSFCAGISTDAYPANPQTGPTDRYGVRVTLDQTYDQNITITGTISSNTKQKNFSLTVTAGNLTAETASNFFAVSPGISVSITISGSSPSTLTKQGLTYGTGCTASDPSDRLDSIAQMHTDYQEYLLTYITDNNLDLSDTTTLKSAINTQSGYFFSSKGISVPTINVILAFGSVYSDTIDYTPGNYSIAGNSILNALKNLILSYDPDNDAAFNISLDSLKNQALGLSDPTEVYSVGIPVAIAISSASYWKENGQNWLDLFAEQDNIRNSGTSLFLMERQYLSYNSFNAPNGPNNIIESPFVNKFKCNIKSKSVLAADVRGGISGFIAGFWGTPVMSLAGGAVGAPVTSAVNILSQAVACLF